MASLDSLVVWLMLVIIQFSKINGLYFGQKNVNLSISIDEPRNNTNLSTSGIIIHRAVVLFNKGDVGNCALKKCKIEFKMDQGKLLTNKSINSSSETLLISSFCPALAIENTTGNIIWFLRNNNTLPVTNFTRCEYKVSAKSGNVSANCVFTFTVFVNESNNSTLERGVGKNTKGHHNFLELQIEENMDANVTIAYFVAFPHEIVKQEPPPSFNGSLPVPPSSHPPTLCILSPFTLQPYLLINASTGAIKTTSKSFDREALNFNKINFTITCSFESNKRNSSSGGTVVVVVQETNGTLTVLDVNDNWPSLYNKKNRPTNKTRLIYISMMRFKEYEHGTRIYPEEPTKLLFRDMDTKQVNQNYLQVISYNDTLSLFVFTLKYYTVSGPIMEAYYPVHTGLYLNINFTENAGYVTPWKDQYCILVGIKDPVAANFASVHFLICVDWSGLIVSDPITPTQILHPNELLQSLIPFVGFAQIGNNAASLSRVLTPYPKLISDYTNAIANLTFDIFKMYVETRPFVSEEEKLSFALSRFHHHEMSSSLSSSSSSLHFNASSPNSSSPLSTSKAITAPEAIQGLFGITHTMGQIYLADADVLSKSLQLGFDLFYIEVNCQSSVIASFKKNVTVLISSRNDDDDNNNNTTASKTKNSSSLASLDSYKLSSSSSSKCNLQSLCAKEREQQACETTCGFASTFGLCRWITTPYFSCTASSPSSGVVNFCPDTFCDELELLNSGLCPQDCNKRLEETSKGTLTPHHFSALDEYQEELINQTSFHGIAECKNNGIVSCVNDMECSCIYNFERKKTTRKPNKTDNVGYDVNNKDEDMKKLNGYWLLSWVIVFFACITSFTICAITLWAVGFLLASKRRLLPVAKRKCDEENPVTDCPVGEQVVVDADDGNVINKDGIESQIVELDSTTSSNNIITTTACSNSEIQKKFLACMEELYKIKQTQLIFTEIQLGKGNFGSVMKAFFKPNANSSNEVPVAIKTIHSNDPKITMSIIWDNIFYEFKFMLALKEHPNVLNVHGIFSDKDEKPYLVMEMAPFGSLRHVLITAESQKQELKPYVLCNFAYQVATGMEYLASKNIIHRDIATRNILLFENNVCKIADFGLARYLTRGEYSNSEDVEYAYQLTNFTSVPVPVRWLAVESLKDGQYSTKTDIWSFGVMLWELFSYAMLPYTDWDDHTVYYNLEAGQRLPIPAKCPQKMYAIMTSCWQMDPDRRPTFTALTTLLSSFKAQE